MKACLEKSCCADGCSQLVCHCLKVTEEQIAEALVTLEIRTLTDLRQCTGAGGGCTACHERLRQILEANRYSASEPICSVK